jgi:hypothetical protein
VWVAGAFITGCGLAHCASGFDPTKQLVWLHGVLRHLTAVACCAAALVAHSLLPLALVTPSPAQLIKEIELQRQKESQLTAQVCERTRLSYRLPPSLANLLGSPSIRSSEAC